MAEKNEKPSLIHPFALIDTVWQAYLKRVPFYTRLVLPPALCYLVLDTFAYVADNGIPNQPFVIFAKTIEHTLPLLIILYVIAFILQTFSTAAVLASLANSKISSVSDAYKEGAGNIASYWWISLLSFLVIMGGVFLFIIPGIIFSIWFTFAQYILFKENLKGADTLLQSREYLRDYFWQVTGRILFIALIAGALSSIVGYVSVVFSNGLISQIAQSFISLITIPLAMLYQFTLYENLREVKKGVSIKSKPWWIYLISSLVPFIIIMGIITAVLFIKPFRVSDTSMMPRYEKGGYLLWGELPVSTYPANNPVMYKKGNTITVRRVFAKPGDTIEQKGEMLTRHLQKPSEDISVNVPYDLSLAVSSFKPSLTILDQKHAYTLKNDEYLLVADNTEGVNPNWVLATKNEIIGEPYLCLLNCTGKE